MGLADLSHGQYQYLLMLSFHNCYCVTLLKCLAAKLGFKPFETKDTCQLKIWENMR